jgi:alkaline phosphatase D
MISLCFRAPSQGHQHRINLNPALRPFYHGVESGDPMPDRVVIWTRVTADSGIAGDINVYWQVATDVNFTNIVNYGTAIATEENHYCVKEDVCGLQPSSFYYYMFNAFGRNSVIGRTKTAPGHNADTDSARFAVVSCASWEHGFFNAYESISNRNDVDAVLHLGDYIYEYASGAFTGNVSGRTYDPPTEAITEIGYELRYSQYKLDDQLRRIHQLFPFITVWDDHETANDAWREGAQNHTPGTEGPYDARKHNSTSAYLKWMPLRQPDPNDSIRIFRKLRYGKLLDLVMLDTRLYDRDEQNLAATNDPNHHMMGPVERAWFLQQLSDTSTRWKIIGNQVMFAPMEIFSQPVNADQWDGYNYERGLIQNHILNTPVKNVVFLTGDIHTSWCNDVPGANYNANTGAGSVCVEFVGASVTSLNSPLPVGASIIRGLNPHMKYINLDDHGYYILNVKKDKTQAEYTYVSTVDQLGASNLSGPNFYVNNNERHLREATAAMASTPIGAANPPLLPDQGIAFLKVTDHYITIPENTSASVNMVPGLQRCPPKTMSIQQGQHGLALSLNGQDITYSPLTDYNGSDTVTILLCTSDSIPVCDTFHLFVTILSIQDIDTITVHLPGDSTYTGCISFNDLTSASIGMGSTTAHHGILAITDSCFSYTTDSAFCGNETIWFIACDSSNNCDTVAYIFKVEYPITASVAEVSLSKNSNITYCLIFDDLIAKPSAIITTLLPQHGTFQMQGDSCVKYFPHFNYVGDDTIRFIACDTCGINHCDTLTVIFHVLTPTSVKGNDDMVVLGMYPNPVDDKLVIQFYLYEANKVTITIYDVLARKLTESKNSLGDGLQHLQLNTSSLPKGNYVIELKTKDGGYSKILTKE